MQCMTLLSPAVSRNLGTMYRESHYSGSPLIFDGSGKFSFRE